MLGSTSLAPLLPAAVLLTWPWPASALPAPPTAVPPGPDPVPAAAAADTVPATLVGRVTSEGGGAPVAGARVLALPAGRLAVTGPDGGFSLPGLPPGVVQLDVVSREGLRWTASVPVPPGGTTAVALSVPTDVAALPELRVEVPAPEPTGRTAGFAARRARAAGVFVGRKEIEAGHDRRTADLLRRLPGVRVVRHRTYLGLERLEMGRPAPAFSGRCPVRILVDGMPLPELERFGYRRLDLELPAPDEIQGVEVYDGPGRVPAALNAPGARCGVVAIWTRDPGAE